MKPIYDLNKIKFATNGPTFEKAVRLYEDGAVTEFVEDGAGYTAVVLGTEPYFVSVDARRYDHGDCECYLGQNDVLCKHMVAVAIRAVVNGKLLSAEDKKQVSQTMCSGRLGELNREKFAVAKKSITGALKYIKPYNGPSRTWFAYQDSLSEGYRRLSHIISELPVGGQTARLLVDTLLRLDDKLCRGGIDDSDGTIGRFIEETVQVLKEFARLDPSCQAAFNLLKGRETSFGWEEPLLEIIDSNHPITSDGHR